MGFVAILGILLSREQRIVGIMNEMFFGRFILTIIVLRI